jgi:hypothetical protein
LIKIKIQQCPSRSKDEARRIASSWGIFEMRTPDQYREFAAECYRLAAEVKTERHRKIMEEMARAWSELAEEVETKITQQR